MDVNLHALVFGESVLNDAVAIVLVEALKDYEENVAECNVQQKMDDQTEMAEQHYSHTRDRTKDLPIFSQMLTQLSYMDTCTASPRNW